MHDILIKNGTVIDGSGESRFVADIAINDGVITEVGDLGGEAGHTEIEARGKCVLPGFIDVSNRTDVYWRLFTDTSLESLLRQGITTIIGGNSGASLAPVYNQQMMLSTQKWANIRDVNVNWQSMREFLATVENHHSSLNFGTFIGHGTLRRGIIGDEARTLTEEELEKLLRYIKEGLAEGAYGVSLGLIYTHARDASTTEIEAVATVVARENRLLAVHLRDEDDLLIDSLDEILSVVRATRVRCHITHLKAVGKSNWSLMAKALEKIEDMRAHGYEITFDLYPYTFTGSVLYTFLPTWLSEGGKTMLLTRLQNKNIYTQAVKELNSESLDLSKAIISLAPQMEQICGQTLGAVAKKRGVTVGEIILEILSATEGRAVIMLDALSEENVVRALESPFSIVTSNSPGYTITEQPFSGALHPRSFGAFPRLFDRYVEKKKTLSWELAVYKSTAKVAHALGLGDRGLLRENMRADVVVVDPNEFRDEARIGARPEYAKGVEWLIVSGSVTIEAGNLTGIRGGEVLRS